MILSKSVSLLFMVLMQHCYGRSMETRNSSASVPINICLYSKERELFMNGRYFSSGYEYRGLNSAGRYTTYYTHILNNYNDCFGITLDNNETIVLECPGEPPKEPGCFDMISSNITSSNSTEAVNKKIERICLKEGRKLITPNKSTIDLFFCMAPRVVNVPILTPRRM